MPEDDRPVGPGQEPEEQATTQLVTLARPSELVPPEFRDVSFRPAVAGYSRRDVDEYVKRVNTAIAELEMSRSPEKAVQLALDRVAEQTAGILQEAGEAAEKLKASALAESEHAARRAHVEAEELMERAQSESHALIERSREESTELLADAQERLDALQEAIGAAREEHRRVLAQLRATAAALDSYATKAEDGEPQPSLAGAGDGEAEAAEQSTDVIPAVDPAAEGPADEDPGASRAQPRHRITGTRQPRAPRREPARSGRAPRAD